MATAHSALGRAASAQRPFDCCTQKKSPDGASTTSKLIAVVPGSLRQMDQGAWPLSLLIALERLLALTVLGETGGSHG